MEFYSLFDFLENLLKLKRRLGDSFELVVELELLLPPVVVCLIILKWMTNGMRMENRIRGMG